MKKLLFFLFNCLIVCELSAQLNKDLTESLAVLLDDKELHSSIFSYVDWNGDSILCVRGKEIVNGDSVFFVQTKDFSFYKKKNIYVKGSAFIEIMNIGYWLTIDSVYINTNEARVFFKTTSLIKQDEYPYVVVNAQLKKHEGVWRLTNKEVKYKYVPAQRDSREEIELLKEYNWKMAEEARAKLRQKNKQ